jgi:hypothetical protein
MLNFSLHLCWTFEIVALQAVHSPYTSTSFVFLSPNYMLCQLQPAKYQNNNIEKFYCHKSCFQIYGSIR